MRTSSLSTQPIFRGRKLVFHYTDGSPCDDGETAAADEAADADADDGTPEGHAKRSNQPQTLTTGLATPRRSKSTVVSLLCERDTYDASRPRVQVSFVGASPDRCAYFFEARSPISCGGMSHAEQAVGPGGVFGIMYALSGLLTSPHSASVSFPHDTPISYQRRFETKPQRSKTGIK